MTPREIKDRIADEGKTTADIVRALCTKYPGVSEGAMRSMVDDIIFGRAYYPRYVSELNALLNISIPRPSWLAPARQRLSRRTAEAA